MNIDPELLKALTVFLILMIIIEFLILRFVFCTRVNTKSSFDLPPLPSGDGSPHKIPRNN